MNAIGRGAGQYRCPDNFTKGSAPLTLGFIIHFYDSDFSFLHSVKEIQSEEAIGILPTALYVGQGAMSQPPHVKVSSKQIAFCWSLFIYLHAKKIHHPVIV